jgi:hypothetical protein
LKPIGLLLIGPVLVSTTPLVLSEDPLDRVSEALTFSMFDQTVRSRISGVADLEGYAFDRPAAGLIDSQDTVLFNPRLSLFLDVQAGDHVYIFTQARFDRGFDPSDHGPEARLDEYAVRVTPWLDGRLNFQAGKFGTIIGNWVPRHLSWDNPFVTAPVPYERLTAIFDTEASSSAAEFVTIKQDELYEYNPVIWGPVYATGASVAGKFEGFEYAAEIKNAGPSSRPESWTLEDVQFDHPNIAGRIGFRPDMRWNAGVSASVGPYYRPEASATLPTGQSIGDFKQILLGQDFRFEWRHFQIWAEAFESRFEVPNAGDADVLSYYLEGKYKFTPQFFGALRWNQQFFGRVSDPTSGPIPWGEDIWRVDSSLGYRFTSHLQLKLQYSLQQSFQTSDFSDIIGVQFTLRF